MKILLVVDVQNDFCPGGALPVRDGHLVVDVINELMSVGFYDLVIGTQDWHPENHYSFADSHRGGEPYKEFVVDGCRQMLWPKHCVAHSRGADFHPRLRSDHFHHVVRKGMDRQGESESGFTGLCVGSGSGLEVLIRLEATERGIKRNSQDVVAVHVVGLALDICVAATAHDSARLGFATTVVVDGCRPAKPGLPDLAATLNDFEKNSIHVASSTDVLQAVNRSTKRICRVEEIVSACCEEPRAE